MARSRWRYTWFPGTRKRRSPSYSAAFLEMCIRDRGVPLRLELGPKDIEKNQCVLARRDSGEKSFVSLDNIEETVKTMLDAVQQGLFDKAKRNLDENTYACATLEAVSYTHLDVYKRQVCASIRVISGRRR